MTQAVPRRSAATLLLDHLDSLLGGYGCARQKSLYSAWPFRKELILSISAFGYTVRHGNCDRLARDVLQPGESLCISATGRDGPDRDGMAERGGGAAAPEYPACDAEVAVRARGRTASIRSEYAESPSASLRGQIRVPRLLIVIGANGAGKTTWCLRNRAELPRHFYDADSIAQGLGGYDDPEHQSAARRMVDRCVAEHLQRREDFGLESTYSGASRPEIARCARQDGYRRHLAIHESAAVLPAWADALGRRLCEPESTSDAAEPCSLRAGDSPKPGF